MKLLRKLHNTPRWAASSQESQFFEQEFEFYSCVVEAGASLAVYLAVSSFIIFSSISESASVRSQPSSRLKPSPVKLLHGLLLACCTRFLLLAALLWLTPTTTFLSTFVDIFFLVSSVSVTRVLTEQPQHQCLLIMLVSHLARASTENFGLVVSDSILICD